MSCDKAHNPDPVRLAAFITHNETRSTLLIRQNRLSSADRLKEKSYELNTELRGNTPWFSLREATMEIIYRIVLWTVVFCHYTWSQEGKNILLSLHEPKRTSEEVLRSVVCTSRAHNNSSF